MRWRWKRLIPAAAAFGLDATTKTWASHALRDRGIVWLWRPWLSLRLLFNTGAMLGAGADHARAITVFSVVAVVALVVLVLRTEQGAAGLTLMLGGAAGNLASRLSRGAVTDFVHQIPARPSDTPGFSRGQDRVFPPLSEHIICGTI